MSKDNSGALFKNDKKRPDKQDPDYNGSAIVNGVPYWLNCWINEKDGRKYMAIKFKEKEGTAAESIQADTAIPF